VDVLVGGSARTSASRSAESNDGKEPDMCMSCGCGRPDDDHGDDRNITSEDLQRAAEAADTTPEQAAENIRSCC
jgi:hypothetical protein